MKQVLTGMLTGAILTVFMLYLLNLGGWVILTGSPGSWSMQALDWIYVNLGFSIIPFAIVGVIYVKELVRLRNLLKTPGASLEDIEDAESKLGLMIVVFIGIGVIWTAIGMRGALLHALNSMDEHTASSRGAWYILTRMVDGGILLALSTTIFGGIGGFCMRIIKTWSIGAELSSFYQYRYSQPAEEVRSLLEEIRDSLVEQSGPNKNPEEVESNVHVSTSKGSTG